MPSFPRSSWLVVALLPLACAVATEPELKDDGDPPSAGTTSISGANSAGTTSVGSTSATGGTTAKAGTGSGGIGNGGTSAAAGKPNTGGTSSAGTAAGGKGGASSAGAAGKGGGGGGGGAGTAGNTGTGCGGLKTWKGGDSTLQIAQGEVIQWMGKRYKATTTIAYPNNECAPDEPVDWCAGWFQSDGDC